MTDEVKQPQPDPQASLKDLEAKFTDRTARLEATVSSLTQRLQESMTGINQVITNLANQKLSAGGQSGSDDDAFFSDAGNGNTEDWYENFKAAPTKAVKELIKPEFSQLKSEIKTEIKKTLATDNEIKKYDDLAYKSFPQLKEDSHPLRKETEKILSESGDDFNGRPSAIYDAARMAYANLVQRGEIVPDSFKEEARRLLSIYDGEMHPFKSGTEKKDKDLTKSQLTFAQKLGVSADRYRERLKQLGNRGSDRD